MEPLVSVLCIATYCESQAIPGALDLTGACNPLVFTFTGFKNVEPSSRLYEPLSNLRTIKLFELWVRNRKA